MQSKEAKDQKAQVMAACDRVRDERLPVQCEALHRPGEPRAQADGQLRVQDVHRGCGPGAAHTQHRRWLVRHGTVVLVTQHLPMALRNVERRFHVAVCNHTIVCLGRNIIAAHEIVQIRCRFTDDPAMLSIEQVIVLGVAVSGPLLKFSPCATIKPRACQ